MDIKDLLEPQAVKALREMNEKMTALSKGITSSPVMEYMRQIPVFAALASWLMLLGRRDAPSCAKICARMMLSSLGRDVRPLRGLALLRRVSRIYAPSGFVPASSSKS